MATFRLFKDRAAEFRWTFRAGNHEEIAVPGEGFKRKDDAEANIALVKRLAPDAPIHDRTVPESDGHHADGGTAEFEVYQDEKREYRWRLQSGNNHIVAVSSEGYKQKDDCLHAIGLVKRDAPSAPVTDETTGSSGGGYVPPTKPADPKSGRFA